MIATDDRNSFEFLKELHSVLESRKSMKAYVIKFKKLPMLKSILKNSDSDEVVVVKVLHKVRCYIHYLQNNRPLPENYGKKGDMMRLLEVHKEIIRAASSDQRKIVEQLHTWARELESKANELPNNLCYFYFLVEFSKRWDELMPVFSHDFWEHYKFDGQNNEDQSKNLLQKSYV